MQGLLRSILPIAAAAGTAAALGTGAVANWLLRRQRRSVPAANPFSDEHITSTFVAALPTITRQLNLEVATTHQVEVFERTDAGAFVLLARRLREQELCAAGVVLKLKTATFVTRTRSARLPAPTVLPAPPAFSTTSAWPRVCVIDSAMSRDTVSVGPPAACGTITVIGLDG